MLYRLTAVCALACTLGSCTVLNLDGFVLPNCEDEAAVRDAYRNGAHLCAAVLNAENGFASADTCRPFRCVELTGQCELSPVERCDGEDNDCDGLIDEDTLDRFSPQRVVEEGQLARIVHAGETLESVSVAADVTNVTVTYTDEEEDAWSFVLGPSPAAVDLVYGRNEENQPWPRLTETLETRNSCWTQSFPGAGSGLSGAPTFAPSPNCNFAAIAADRIQNVGLVAAINAGAGCPEGQLRVGHTSGDEPAVFQVNGPWERSNSFLGVGLTSDGRCTATQAAACQAAIEATRDGECEPACGPDEFCDGTSCVADPPATCESDADCGGGGRCIAGLTGTSVCGCTNDGECPGTARCLCQSCVSAGTYDRAQLCGVSDIALAGTPIDDEPRAVVGFTSGSRLHRCGDFERDVAIVGAARVRGSGANALDFVTTTNEAVPQVLGQTRGSAAPAIYGLQDQYVVAYPTPASDALAIHVINAFPDLVATGDEFTAASCLGDVVGETVACPGPEAVCGLTDCGSDVGVCVSGEQSCFRGEGICDGHVAGTEEVCANGTDEDCDGVIDEDTDGRPCLADCIAEAETCNARDDDCDGMVDEDTGGALCGTAPPIPESACVQGTEVCRGGKLHCMGSIEPAVDATGNGIEYTVDGPAGFPYGVGIDDDCDGVIDEPGVNNVTSCAGDGSMETCNGRDDDLDCVIDEDGRLQPADFIDTPETERPKGVVRQCIEEPSFPELPATVVEGGLGFGRMDDLTIAGTTFARGDEISIGVAWSETNESDPRERRIGFRILRFETDCVCRTPAMKPNPEPLECSCDTDDPDYDPECPCSVPVLCSEDICSESAVGQIVFVGATDPVEVTTVPAGYGPPHISYAPRGFIVAGSERSGREVTRDGGFVVTYTQPIAQADMVFRDAAMVRFFAEHDGLARNANCDAVSDECEAAREEAFMDGIVLPPCEPCSANITMYDLDGEMRGVADAAFPRSYFDPQTRETRYLYYDLQNSEFVSYPFMCAGD